MGAVLRWSYGNLLDNDLFMLNCVGKYGDACGNASGKTMKLW